MCDLIVLKFFFTYENHPNQMYSKSKLVQASLQVCVYPLLNMYMMLVLLTFFAYRSMDELRFHMHLISYYPNTHNCQ